MRKKRFWIDGLCAACCVVIAAAVIGCALPGKKAEAGPAQEVDDSYSKEEVHTLAETADETTVWSAYWDCADTLRVLRSEKEYIQAVSLFEAYFKDDEIVIPEATEKTLNQIRNRETMRDMTVFLSFVNDVDQNGTIVQKDTDILKKHIGSEVAARAHAEHLVEIASEGGYDGVEIDYEKIRPDMELWDDFLRFEDFLLEAASEKNLKVRIVLEPSTPVEDLTFPEGAEYVVMCYNLYGGGTEPGPKADRDFLKELKERFGMLSDISYAFADGGFDWEGDSQKAKQLRASEAAEMAERYEAKPVRDVASGALHFEYTKSGTKHTVWYADEETLKLWAEWLKEEGADPLHVSLWRL